MSDEIRDATTDVAAAIEAGFALGTRVMVAAEGGRPFTILPNGSVVTLEGFLPAPATRRADVQVHESGSFSLYVTRFKDPSSLIFADRPGRTFTAVLDYHGEGADGPPRWGRHRVGLLLKATVNWQTWETANKRAMNQAQFAQFLEDNIPDIADPAGAEIVEIVRTLEARKSATFESAIRAKDGSFTFAYSEDVQGTAKRGSVAIPDLFTLGLAPFEGSEKYKVEARLRYRIDQGGKLVIWFELVRPQDVLDAAFNDELEDIKAQCAGVPVLFGPAPGRQTAE